MSSSTVPIPARVRRSAWRPSARTGGTGGSGPGGRRRVRQAGPVRTDGRGRPAGSEVTRPSSSVTTPVPPSTRTRWPVRRVATALPVPTTAGIPYSRQTIAVWLMIPPTSDTVAAIRANTGAHDGDVAGHTRTSPGSTEDSSETCVTTRTGPSTTPGEPPVPRSVRPSAVVGA